MRKGHRKEVKVSGHWAAAFNVNVRKKKMDLRKVDLNVTHSTEAEDITLYRLV